jgi:EAL domain-containing protein (putative c-di-GMP-specific phosphodiesterase class I)
MEDINDFEAANRLADWIQLKFASPYTLSGHNVFITASIGIVFSSGNYQRAEDVLRDADIAMFVAKGHGKARYEIFNPAMRDRITQRLELETDLREAFENRILMLYYQPIVSLIDGKLIGFEALLRWKHPERGFIPPADFIPVAEETGLIIPLDRWVLREACQQMHAWHLDCPTNPPLTIHVNLSGKHIAQPDLADQIKMILRETGLGAASLKLEITENTFMNNTEDTTSMLSKIQAMGVQVQIDDFGIGYSSLGYLSHFPIDALKIDQTFVSKMSEDYNHLEIVQAIVALTHRLGLGVIAEGVETQSQLNQLKALGCEYGQGFLLSIPLSSEDARLFIENVVSKQAQPPVA